MVRKKLFAFIIAACIGASLFCGCTNGGGTPTSAGSDNNVTDVGNGNADNDDLIIGDTSDNGNGDEQAGDLQGNVISTLSDDLKANLSADGYVKGKISDFSQYEGTSAYRVVTTADELVQAILDAKCHYTNVWDEDTSTYSQVPADGYTQDNFTGTVRVIEIAADINLGYYTLSSFAKNSGVVDDYAKNASKWSSYLCMSDMLTQNGISQIKIETTSHLLVYSKNGAKLTHGGFKLTSDTDVVFRNLEFDEMWQWEDAPTKDTSKIGDYDWFGWAYFKIAFCGYIWIDHCTFGKSYDGQIDYSNPVYDANASTAFRAPYGADGGNGLHISWCSFNAGSDDEDGYLYKMMAAIEESYLKGESSYLYYNALRDGGASFEEILYGIAIPQKKGFLCGDDATFSGSYDNADDYNYNLKLCVSFGNCKFIDLEDRLPKLRGGNAYMYNCIVDSSRYYSYRTKLQSLGAKSKVTAVNSTWKCGLVSQGVVCGNGGSVKAENCIFRGVQYLLKNNDTKNSSPYVDGGYMLVNCLYQQSASSTEYIGSSSDENNKFTNDSGTKLTTANFAWHTEDGGQPFDISPIDIPDLQGALSDETYGAGTNAALLSLLLKSEY